MMQRRRASVIVVFALLTSTATAYADCAWVLWQQQGDTRRSSRAREDPCAAYDQTTQPDGKGAVLGVMVAAIQPAPAR
jgi:hypothetical protein